MSVVSEATRDHGGARAGHRCEYCHLPTRGQAGTFPIDHVTPRSLAGPTTLDNLALACPGRNGHKW
jgi:5-methylcytosine-specific restriction endonuclease McrA